MLQTSKSILALCLAALATGCAGKNFVRPTPDAFKLGSTTQGQVVQQLGDPLREGTAVKNGATVKSIVYAYSETAGDALEDGVVPARSMAYFFVNEKLVGQEFTSSFKSDHSNFDDAKVPTIVKGKTTRAEVVQLLGKPTCLYIAPMVKETSGEAVGWAYGTTRGNAFSGFKFAKKALLVSFDGSDRVSDVQFTSSASK